MLAYDLFYRHSGVRIPQQLMTPIITSMEKFEFPKNSLFNSISYDGVRSAPSSDEYLFRLINKQILMDHVVNLTEFTGNPRRINTQITPYIREYHVHNRRFRLSKDMVKTDREQNTLMVTNYDFLPKAYRYTRNKFTEAYIWHNLTKTLCDTIESQAKVSQRQQFILIDLPTILPSVTSLDLYSKVFNTNYLNIFNTAESKMILEIWKWLGEDSRKDSILNTLSKDSLSKVNIIYRDVNKWLVVNLGVLNSWRYVKVEDNEPGQKIKITPADLQKRFLRMLMGLMHLRSTPSASETENPETTADTVASSPEENPLKNELKPIVAEQELTDGVALNNEETRLEASNRLLASIDDDLKQLDVIESLKLSALVNADSEQGDQNFSDSGASLEDFNKEVKPEDAIIKICNKQADDGIITAAVFKNLVSAASTYKTLKAPGMDVSLEEYINIPPEDLAINESKPIKSIATVLDKSMLKSSLLTFDEKYVEKVLSKDIAGMVVGIQKAGVILNDYTIERHNELLGEYEVHTMRVRPVEGVSSVLHFRIPVVQEDGTLTIAGNRYRLRKQRSDCPIRKISPRSVALTSYYGKTFVNRNDKKVNDYGNWLCNNIMLKGLDSTDETVSNIATGDVFNNDASVPRVYSAISQNFISFNSQGYSFNFDINSIEKIHGKENSDKQKEFGVTLVAINNKDESLGIDIDNNIVKIEKSGNKILGTIENFLGLNPINSPIDFSELKVMGKNISVGLVLAYDIGLSELCERLKVEPRKVLAGNRLNLEHHEYAITFSDVSLVFSKKDKLATLILAGFNEYDKVIRRYSVAAMDKPNVYLNILESAGMTVRHLRELQNLNGLFVDPITKELLVEMKEPTTFHGLLVRGSELLLTDEHPDQLDMRYMRIKGYERIAGAVYSELVHSVRSHSNRPGKHTKPLELHPYAVWKRITADPAMALISDLNPIENLKQMEAVTYSGEGGRNSRTMTRDTRQYHETDIGVISESTVDSSGVGINIFTSADPQFKSVRGTTKPFVLEKAGPAAMLSTSALMSPSSDHDDPKRVKKNAPFSRNTNRITFLKRETL